MKIRSCFVSNSSSCSFMIVSSKSNSDKKVADDFIDFAFNNRHIYDNWDNYLKIKLEELKDEEYFVEKYKDEKSQIDYIRKLYEDDCYFANQYNSEERLEECSHKLFCLFSMDETQRIPGVSCGWYPENKSLPVNSTVKLTSYEIRQYLSDMRKTIRRYQRIFNFLNKISEDEYVEYSKKYRDEYRPKKHHEFLCVPWFMPHVRATQVIHDWLYSKEYEYDRWMAAIDGLNNIDKYSYYVIDVASSGDGEDDDNVYSFLNDRNYEWYSQGKYCFKIVSTESM